MASNKVHASISEVKVSQETSTITAMNYELWNQYLENTSRKKPSQVKDTLLVKLFSFRLHDLLYDREVTAQREQLLYELVKKIRIQQPYLLALMDLISFHLQIAKGQWSKALNSGIKFSRTQLVSRLSLPNLEYFLYHLNRVSELEKHSLNSSLRFSTNRWLLPSNEDLKQANIAFFLFQTKFLKLEHQSSIQLDSKFYDAYLNTLLQVSEYGLKLPQLNPWGELRARRNPRRRRLLHLSQGLPPQLTLALLKIKKSTRVAQSDFQLYNAYLQQAFLSELAGRDKQFFNSIKAASGLHSNPSLYLKLASFYKSRKDYSTMHKYNQKALKLDPDITVISGPKPEVYLKQNQITQPDSLKNIISILSKNLKEYELDGKRIHEIVNKITQLKNSEDFNKQINILLEQSIPLEKLGHWLGTWVNLYRVLEPSIQNRLQARFLLWLQIMIYSKQTPQQKLSFETLQDLKKIAQNSILGTSINKCLNSTSPAALHR
tara:strand:+ start:1985 stop:3454 length:1470 start_codon:yes stop_codon:yes gene_type:complete